MDRIEKRCVVASVALHGMLVGIVLVGAAFGNRAVPPIRPITLIRLDGPLTDRPSNGGGGGTPVSTPNPPAPTPTPTPPAPTPTPPPPAPAPTREVVTPPAPVTPAVMKSKNPLQREDKKKPVKETEANDKTKVKADPAFTKQTRKNTEKSTSKDNSDNDHSKLIAKATGQRNSRIDSVLGDLKNISNGGLRMSDMPGNGAGGGPGAANYSQAVLGAYDDAWNPPPEITDDVAVAVAKVRVHRSGRITEARIIKRSNNALMDRSVQNALEAVKSLPPFPEGATDLERVFNIEFNLKAKRATG